MGMKVNGERWCPGQGESRIECGAMPRGPQSETETLCCISLFMSRPH